MTKKHDRWVMSAVAVALVFALAAPLSAQEETPPEQQVVVPSQTESAQPEATPDATVEGADSAAPAAVDPLEEFAQRLRRIQEQESEQSYTARGYVYDPGNRRDPFVSPHELTASAEADATSTLPPGIGRMRVQELELMGFVDHPTWGKRAIVRGSDRMGYWLKEGDRLADGVIVYIDTKNSEVIFRQDVTDPLAIKPYREVKRQLRPVDEERRKK